MFFILKSVMVGPSIGTDQDIGFANVLDVESDAYSAVDPVKKVRPIKAFCVASVNWRDESVSAPAVAPTLKVVVGGKTWLGGRLFVNVPLNTPPEVIVSP